MTTTASQLKNQSRQVRKEKADAKAEADRKALAARRKASASQIAPLLEECLRAAAEAAAEGKSKTSVYAGGLTAYDAADRVADRLRKQGFQVKPNPGYTIFAGMNVEGYGGSTSYHAMWYISWDEDHS